MFWSVPPRPPAPSGLAVRSATASARKRASASPSSRQPPAAASGEPDPRRSHSPKSGSTLHRARPHAKRAEAEKSGRHELAHEGRSSETESGRRPRFRARHRCRRGSDLCVFASLRLCVSVFFRRCYLNSVMKESSGNRCFFGPSCGCRYLVWLPSQPPDPRPYQGHAGASEPDTGDRQDGKCNQEEDEQRLNEFGLFRFEFL